MEIIYSKSPERCAELAKKKRRVTDMRRVLLERAQEASDDSFERFLWLSVTLAFIIVGLRLTDLVSWHVAATAGLAVLLWTAFRWGSWLSLRRKRREAIKRCS